MFDFLFLLHVLLWGMTFILNVKDRLITPSGDYYELIKYDIKILHMFCTCSSEVTVLQSRCYGAVVYNMWHHCPVDWLFFLMLFGYCYQVSTTCTSSQHNHLSKCLLTSQSLVNTSCMKKCMSILSHGVTVVINYT